MLALSRLGVCWTLDPGPRPQEAEDKCALFPSPRLRCSVTAAQNKAPVTLARGLGHQARVAACRTAQQRASLSLHEALQAALLSVSHVGSQQQWPLRGRGSWETEEAGADGGWLPPPRSGHLPPAGPEHGSITSPFHSSAGAGWIRSLRVSSRGRASGHGEGEFCGRTRSPPGLPGPGGRGSRGPRP